MNCRHFGVCGGCTLPGVSYPDQLSGKRAALASLLRIEVPPLVPSPRVAGYRSKVAFVFGRGGMGHFALGSQRLIPVDECPVHNERGNRIAFALRDHLRRIPDGILRHILIRTTDDGKQAVAMLVVRRNDKALRGPVKKFLASSPERPDGFYVNIHDAPGPYMVGDETIKIDGRSHVKETIDGVSYLVSPTAFFQTNVGAAAQLVSLVTAAVGDAPRVLDLFCGSGLFALPLAKRGSVVVGVEESRQAIADADANVRINKLSPSRIRFLASRVEDALPRLARDPWDVVILDPPRHGCPPAVLSGVFDRLHPSRAVYVSCDPESLANELPTILKAGYRITSVQPVDMFPHTKHIETVIVFDAQGPGTRG